MSPTAVVATLQTSSLAQAHGSRMVISTGSRATSRSSAKRTARCARSQVGSIRSSAGKSEAILRTELWVYGGDRSCKVVAGETAFACGFFLGQAQVAFGPELGNIPAAVAAWLIARVSVRLLATHVRGVELEPYADVLETDPPRWHWLHVRDRISDPSDVLAPLRELIGRLATSPVATTFYSYSSLYLALLFGKLARSVGQ